LLAGLLAQDLPARAYGEPARVGLRRGEEVRRPAVLALRPVDDGVAVLALAVVPQDLRGQQGLRLPPGALIERLAGLRPLSRARGDGREEDESDHDEPWPGHHGVQLTRRPARHCSPDPGARATEIPDTEIAATEPGPRPAFLREQRLEEEHVPSPLGGAEAGEPAQATCATAASAARVRARCR